MFVLFVYLSEFESKQKKIRKSGTVLYDDDLLTMYNLMKKNDSYYDIRSGYLVKFNDFHCGSFNILVIAVIIEMFQHFDAKFFFGLSFIRSDDLIVK